MLHADVRRVLSRPILRLLQHLALLGLQTQTVFEHSQALLWPLLVQGARPLEPARVLGRLPGQHRLDHVVLVIDRAASHRLLSQGEHLTEVLFCDLQVVIGAVAEVVVVLLLLSEAFVVQEARVSYHLAVTLDAPEYSIDLGLVPLRNLI